MTTAITKVRIKVGALEIECEGSEIFMKDNLPNLIAEIKNLIPSADMAESLKETINNKDKSHSYSPDETIELSTSTIAARLGAKSGAELVIAAADHLTLSEGKSSFSRSDLLDSMKSATGFYKSSLVKNLSAYINTLIKNSRLNEISKNLYILPQSEKSSLEGKLGGSK